MAGYSAICHACTEADFYFIVVPKASLWERQKLFIKLKNIITAMSSAKHKSLERDCGEGNA